MVYGLGLRVSDLHLGDRPRVTPQGAKLGVRFQDLVSGVWS